MASRSEKRIFSTYLFYNIIKWHYGCVRHFLNLRSNKSEIVCEKNGVMKRKWESCRTWNFLVVVFWYMWGIFIILCVYKHRLAIDPIWMTLSQARESYVATQNISDDVGKNGGQNIFLWIASKEARKWLTINSNYKLMRLLLCYLDRRFTEFF